MFAVVESGEHIARARALARSFLTELQARCGLREQVRGSVEVSELVTNARRHAPGPCLLTLARRHGGIAVAVWDGGSSLTTIGPRDPSRIGRHGLEVVTALSRSFEIHRETTGKRITAVVPLTDHSDGISAAHRTT
ncbi:ATP-binding protein [Streptomyces sp. NPDC127114]|uniref:ATP-binding protein n=1 Tax=Streptomyces sp. NPDC127114 TaxID=3345366 RepID=UPI003626FD4E